MSINFFKKPIGNSISRVGKSAFKRIHTVSGGDINNLQPGNGYAYHTFINPGSLTVKTLMGYNPSKNRVISSNTVANNAELLVVGGGAGAAGHAASGGGGAGGVAWSTNIELFNETYSVSIGPGGATGGPHSVSYSGSPTTFTSPSYTITGLGGGASGAYSSGTPGGSGGGASGYPQPAQNQVAGTSTQLFQPQTAGANVKNFGAPGGWRYIGPTAYHAGAGGGGAGQCGNQSFGPSGCGAGGDGIQLNEFAGPLIGLPGLNPFNGYFAGGGGGTSWTEQGAASGGLGGGGSGSNHSGTGQSGQSHTGGGGGGSNGPNTGSAGGSGIVAVRYEKTAATAAIPVTATSVLQVTVPKNGLTTATAATSAYRIKRDFPNSISGFYYIIGNNQNPVLVYCDMTQDGGGWMHIHRCNGTGASGATETRTTNAVGSIAGAILGTETGTIPNTYKVADADINYWIKNCKVGLDRPLGHTLPCFRAHCGAFGPSNGNYDYFTVHNKEYGANYAMAHARIDFRGIGNDINVGSLSTSGWNDYAEFLSSPRNPLYTTGHQNSTYTGWGNVIFYNHNNWGNHVIYNSTGHGFYTGSYWDSTGGLWYR
jgi:hypothetical protein